MEVEITAGPPEPLPGYRVAVVGRPAWADDPELLARLLLALTGARRGTHQITLVSVGSQGPPLMWAHDLWWGIELVAGFGDGAKRDKAVAEWADALLVLGGPEPWRRLAGLFEAAEKPVRCHARPPRVPPLLHFRAQWEVEFAGGLRAG